MPFKRYDKSFKRDSCCFHSHSHSLVSISLLIDIEIEMSLPEFRIVNGLIFLFFLRIWSFLHANKWTGHKLQEH